MSGDTRTPEEIIHEAPHGQTWDFESANAIVTALHQHGYVIVHPNDVPSKDGSKRYNEGAANRGWNDCRRHIFAGGPVSDTDIGGRCNE